MLVGVKDTTVGFGKDIVCVENAVEWGMTGNIEEEDAVVGLGEADIVDDETTAFPLQGPAAGSSERLALVNVIYPH